MFASASFANPTLAKDYGVLSTSICHINDFGELLNAAGEKVSSVDRGGGTKYLACFYHQLHLLMFR